MKPIVVVLSACLLVALLQPAVAQLLCYECVNKVGDCTTGTKQCSSYYDADYRCYAIVTTAGGVSKSCSTASSCTNAVALCVKEETCKEVFCCSSNYCNSQAIRSVTTCSSISLKPILVLVALATVMAWARGYMM